MCSPSTTTHRLSHGQCRLQVSPRDKLAPHEAAGRDEPRSSTGLRASRSMQRRLSEETESSTSGTPGAVTVPGVEHPLTPKLLRMSRRAYIHHLTLSQCTRGAHARRIYSLYSSYHTSAPGVEHLLTLKPPSMSRHAYIHYPTLSQCLFRGPFLLR